MKKLALFALLSLSACLGDPTGGTSSSSSSSSTSIGVETDPSSSGSTDPCSSEGCGLDPLSEEPSLVADPEVAEDACPDNWCATGGGAFCKCDCPTVWPYKGTSYCCDGSFSNPTPVNGAGGCNNGQKKMQCKKSPSYEPEASHPETVPPDSCSGTYSCPYGYFPDNITPGSGCDTGWTCPGSCTGNLWTCATGYCSANT